MYDGTGSDVEVDSEGGRAPEVAVAPEEPPKKQKKPNGEKKDKKEKKHKSKPMSQSEDDTPAPISSSLPDAPAAPEAPTTVYSVGHPMAKAGVSKPGKGKGTSGYRSKRTPRTGFYKRKENPLTRPAIRRLARRGGVKRISKDVYDEDVGLPAVLRSFVTQLVKDAIIYTEHARRKTMTVMDVKHALKFEGRPLYM